MSELEENNTVILVRVSTPKQSIEGDSHEDQLEVCRWLIEENKLHEIKIFPLIESGAASERLYFQDVLAFCTNPANKVKYIVFKNIGRFTREGSEQYQKWKRQLEASGVKLRDASGVIRDRQNTLAHLGVSYEWSEYSPSESEEIAQANRAKDERRDILSLMIGAEIRYTRMGYWNRKPPYGYQNQKIETVDHGKRNVLVESPDEAFFVKKAFELATKRQLTYQQMADQLNLLGYVSRSMKRRDRFTKKPIGDIGRKKMTATKLEELLKKPVYAGVICERWSHYQPIKARFPGLVSLEQFNAANISKVKLIDGRDRLTIKFGKDAESNDPIKKRRTRNNPLYPFKNIVSCPQCNQTLSGSAPKSRNGTSHPTYHCSGRGKHKYWGISRKTFHETIFNFIKRIKYRPEFGELFKAVFYETYDEMRGKAVEESSVIQSRVADLLTHQKQLLETIAVVTSPKVREQFERQYEEIEAEITAARNERATKEKIERDVKRDFKYGLYFVEHLEFLLIDEGNPARQEQLFGLLFDEFPSYEDLLSGTAKLSPFFQLIQSENMSKSVMVTPRGIEPRFPG